ncbi:MAG: hypothetical protein Q8L41_08365 [Anaerolineales bacterium]|nr:hypothetical protein [Anaerolineales bacterium]
MKERIGELDCCILSSMRNFSLPQVVETNPPQPMDVMDVGLLYDLIGL